MPDTSILVVTIMGRHARQVGTATPQRWRRILRAVKKRHPSAHLHTNKQTRYLTLRRYFAGPVVVLARIERRAPNTPQDPS